jgi:hypothetical protein
LRDDDSLAKPKGSSDHGIPWAEISLNPNSPYPKA